MAIESGEEKKGLEVKSVSPDKMFELVQQLQKQVQELTAKQDTRVGAPTLNIDDITKIIAATKQSAEGIDINYKAGIDESQIPTDDYLETPVLFFSPCGGTVIVDDKRQGYRVLPPFGIDEIWFDNPAGTKIQKGKDLHLIVISTYLCKSKKLAEWLRKHTLFGTKFHESIEQTISRDVVRAQKLSRTMTDVQQYSPHDLIRHAKTYKIEIGTDYDKMRFKLAEVMVDAEESREIHSAEQALLSSQKDRLVFDDHIAGKGE